MDEMKLWVKVCCVAATGVQQRTTDKEATLESFSSIRKHTRLRKHHYGRNSHIYRPGNADILILPTNFSEYLSYSLWKFIHTSVIRFANDGARLIA
ncbi:uncharacterized protein LAJ45_00177 [Morchella importuna]|uniref:uncharacterized protein n=1 Tax=Morchella importuna TaxID=1174673 RepID=UPI001E8D6252|nr:uncharacterized protein LAJ45_00177 [Morchella importuna]KAH8155168.1 hypothetical protein LAJ45_00177 [Morchella importuna]